MLSFRVSRFVSAFLALAFIASLITWLVPGLFRAPTAPPKQDQVAATAPSGLTGKSAFVEPLPTPPARPLAEAVSGNLTNRLAETLAQKLMEANPDGPSAEGGELAALPPDLNATLASFLQTPDIYAPVVADSVEVLVTRSDPKQVRIIKKATAADEQTYLSSLTDVLQKNFLNDQFQNIFSGAASPEAINSAQVIFGQTLRKLDTLSVPSSYLNLHLAARDMFLRLHNLTLTPVDSTEDPVRTILASERESDAALLAVTRFEQEMAKVSPEKVGSAESGSDKISWLTSLTTIPVANAQFVPVFDPATVKIAAEQTAFNFKAVLRWLKGYLLEVLKNQLVHRLVQQAVHWIQGGGRPQFVTNWKGFLENIGNDVAGRILQRINPALCRPFEPLIRIAFQPVNLALDTSVTCTLDQVVQNVQQFSDDFTKGGWVAYGAALQPQNNFFGAFMETSDIISAEQSRAMQAKQQEAQAGKGYLPTQVCVKWHNEEVTPGWTPPTPANTPEGLLAARSNPVVIGSLNTKSVCDEYKTTTPPSTIGDLVSQSASAPLLRIVNAQDIAGLVNALVNSIASKLITTIKNASKPGEDPGLLSITIESSTASFADMCEGLTGHAYRTCKDEILKSCAELPLELQRDCTRAVAPPENPTTTATTTPPQ